MYIKFIFMQDAVSSLSWLSLLLSKESQDDTISNTLLFKTFLRMRNASVFFSVNGFSLL